MTMPRVLVVDDDPSARLHAQRLLAASVLRAEMAGDPEHALELLRVRAGTELAFAVIVADDKMPVMTGGDLIEHVARVHPGVVRAIVSGYDNALHEVGRAHLPHWSFAKPLKGDTIAHALRSSMRARDKPSV